MDYLSPEEFSPIQLCVMQEKSQQHTYKEIREKVEQEFKITLYDPTIKVCIMRSVLGYTWEHSLESGDLPYLCPTDMTALKNEVYEAAAIGASMDANEVLDSALKLKTERVVKAFTFLKITNSPVLYNQLASQVIDPPTRSWINGVLDDLEANLKDRRMIDPKRLESASFEVITNHFVCFSSLLKSINPLLLFGADETMMSCNKTGKAVIPEKIKQLLEKDFPQMPHVSGMMCNNVLGVPLPPFIILPNLKKLPNELLPLVSSGQIWVASSANGYMTKELFLIWVFHFINWLSDYRTKLPIDVREEKCLLIMDGHTSRENPLALLLLRKFRVEVLILPSHTTHVLQMFDVGLASPLKKKFTERFRKLLSEFDENDFQSFAAKVRLAAITAFVDAWRSVCTPSNCASAARATGTFPVSVNEVEKSPFVRDLTAEEQERYNQRQARNANRVTISGALITDADFIVKLATQLMEIPTNKRYCALTAAMKSKYSTIVSGFTKNPQNGCLLSPLPPFITPNGAPLYFDTKIND